MTLIINLLTYLVGIIWLAAGLSGVINPAIFTESDWASLHVQITGTLGMSDIRSLGGLFAAIGLGVLYASHNPSGKKGWFSAFSWIGLQGNVYECEKVTKKDQKMIMSPFRCSESAVRLNRSDRRLAN